METITFNNGVEMPVLGLGTFKAKGDDCRNAVETALRCGYRAVDTAEAYGNEEQVGEGIRRSGVPRGEIFLTTKINIRSYENAEEAVRKCMERLGTDYIDLLLLHWPFGDYYAAWRSMEKMYRSGVLRAIGVSNFNPDRLIDLIGFHEIVPAVDQVETNLYCQRQEAHKWMDKYQVRHESYSPLGQGRRNEMLTDETVLALAAKYGKTAPQILLRFLIQQDVAVIPKSVTPSRIAENIDVFDFRLTEDELASLRAKDTGTALSGTPEKPEKVEIAMTW